VNLSTIKHKVKKKIFVCWISRIDQFDHFSLILKPIIQNLFY